MNTSFVYLMPFSELFSWLLTFYHSVSLNVFNSFLPVFSQTQSFQSKLHSRQAWLYCFEWHHRREAMTGWTGGMWHKREIQTVIDWRKKNARNNRWWRDFAREGMRIFGQKIKKNWEGERIPFNREWMEFTRASPSNTHTLFHLISLQPSSPSALSPAASLSSLRLGPPFLFVVLSLISFRGIRQRHLLTNSSQERTFSFCKSSI